MSLERRIELIHRSSQRLMDALKLPHDQNFWRFIRKELWVHLKRTLEAWWYMFWGEPNED